MQIITVDESGITKLLPAEILENIKNRFLVAFPNLTFDSASIDGFLLNTITDLTNEIAEVLISQAFNFDIDTAEGEALDRLANNFGIKRVAGLRTVQSIEITTNKVVSLEGGVFKVKDQSQNIFTLLDNATNLSIGTHTLIFQADEVGAINPPLNTVNIIETPINSVISANNVISPSTIGVDYETDDIFRRRVKKSFTINALGYLKSLRANLLNIDGVIDVAVFQNSTDSVDSLGINPRSVACVVEGGQGIDIANVIADNILGQSTQGSISEVIIIENSSITVEFSRSTNIPLYVDIDLENKGNYNNLDFIKTAIVENLTFSIQEEASADRIIQTIKNIPNINVIIDNLEISVDDITYANAIETSSFVEKFVMDFDKININIV